MPPAPPSSTLFPYTTLFRSLGGPCRGGRRPQEPLAAPRGPGGSRRQRRLLPASAKEPTEPSRRGGGPGRWADLSGRRDRKSTRLNSSHVKISYAVFCLKKKM